MAEAEGSGQVDLPDGSHLPVSAGATAGSVLSHWRPGDTKRVLAALWNGAPVDLSFPIPGPGRLSPLTFEDRQGRDILQHSSAHLVAKAVVETVAGALPTAGPPTEEGFYYDFDVRPLTEEDRTRIEAAIAAEVKAGERFERLEASREEAESWCSANPHKLGYIRDIPQGQAVSFYRTGTFLDLCRGPHVPDTTWLKGLEIVGVSAVSADGTATGPTRQRIRGVGFPTRELLEEHRRRRKEAEARDHRIGGARQELFMFLDEAPGFPIWLPKGMIIVRELEKFVTEHLASAGYSEIRTPLLFAQSVYETSGHWEHYRENMFLTEVDHRTFGWKPMNCPGSMLIFRSRARSYRELPLRMAEFAPLHRYEASGTLHGLTRVREFVQDDAHLFVTEEQVEPELTALMEWIRQAFTTFHLEWSYELSTRPAGFLGDAAEWDRAEATLERVLKASGVAYKVSAGEGAFYAPKIDIHIRDSLGRPWQTGTIQLDHQMPRRFGCQYQGPDGTLHTPAVIHRTILGTWERFFGVFYEHCAGRLPPWMSPTQVRVLPVTERHQAASDALVAQLKSRGIRADGSGSGETLGKRVREAELERIPYVVVLGDQEMAGGTVAVRTRAQKGQQSMPTETFVGYVLARVKAREYDP